ELLLTFASYTTIGPLKSPQFNSTQLSQFQPTTQSIKFQPITSWVFYNQFGYVIAMHGYAMDAEYVIIPRKKKSIEIELFVAPGSQGIIKLEGAQAYAWLTNNNLSLEQFDKNFNLLVAPIAPLVFR